MSGRRQGDGQLGAQPGEPGHLGKGAAGNERAHADDDEHRRAVNQGNGPGCGRAASTGTIGSRPPSEPDQ